MDWPTAHPTTAYPSTQLTMLTAGFAESRHEPRQRRPPDGEAGRAVGAHQRPRLPLLLGLHGRRPGAALRRRGEAAPDQARRDGARLAADGAGARPVPATGTAAPKPGPWRRG